MAAMKAAGLGSATQIDEGGEGWDTGRELADAIQAAKSTAAGDVKNALQQQKLTVGGIVMYSWTRTSSDHSAMTGSGDSAMVTVGPDGSFNVREMLYDGAGHKISVSELQAGNAVKKTQFLNLDPDGRATLIRPADSVLSSHDVTVTYGGAQTVTRTVKVGQTLAGGVVTESPATTT